MYNTAGRLAIVIMIPQAVVMSPIQSEGRVRKYRSSTQLLGISILGPSVAEFQQYRRGGSVPKRT